MRFSLSLLVLVSGLFLLPACGSDDVVDGNDDENGDPTSGDASMEVSGAVEAEYTGAATYNTLAGAAHFVTIVFDDGEGNASITIEGLSGEGSYEIGRTTSEPAALEMSLDDVDDLEGAFSGFVLIETGSVTITDVDDYRLEGRFVGSGETGATGNPEIAVDGEFVAICLNAPGITCE